MASPLYATAAGNLPNRPALTWKRIADSPRIHLTVIIFLTLATRIVYLTTEQGRILDSDESVFGLMALKIAALKEFPLYCWEAQYAGTLVSYIGAVLFKIFGVGALQLRLAMLPFSLVVTVLFYGIYRKLFSSSVAFLAVLYLIFSPLLVLQYTMAALGGYGETFLGVALIITVSWHIARKGEQFSPRAVTGWFVLLGAICGFFFYILFLIVPVVCAFALVQCIRTKKNFINRCTAFVAGGLIGILPLIAYNLTHGGGTIIRGLSRSTTMGKEALAQPYTEVVFNIILQKITYIFGWLTQAPFFFSQYIYPFSSYSVLSLISGLLCIALLLFLPFIAWRLAHTGYKKAEYLGQFALFFIILIVFAWLGNLNRARHLLPVALIIPVAFFSISFVLKSRRTLLYAVFCVLCCIQIFSWRQTKKSNLFQPASTTQAMQHAGIKDFYGSYWTVYPIMFRSGGTLRGSPGIVASGDVVSDRRPDYTKEIHNNPQAAFVFSTQESGIKNNFCWFLHSNRIAADSILTEHAVIYYNLSKQLIPEQSADHTLKYTIVKSEYPISARSYNWRRHCR
jgi:hypothetical protein